VIASGDSDRQVRAIADNVQHALLATKRHALSVEGLSTAHWIVMDYADVVVHVFRSDVRGHYALEKLWSDAKRVRIPAESDAALAPLRAPKRRTARVRERR
jgi:ribosome-associated protein